LTQGLAALSRRTFLQAIGQTTGAVAVHDAMRGLGLFVEDPPPPAVTGRAPRGARVVILGGGLAGLAAAIELEGLGYHVDVLEARKRPGGRAFSVRGGTASEEPAQAGLTASYDDGLYLNAGPARIPHHHAATLAWCRELGVAIEPFLCTNEATWVHDGTSRQKMRLKELRADWRGHTSELLAKAVSKDALDAPMTADDRDRLIDWLRREGALTPDLTYAGTPRRGYREPPGPADAAGVLDDPLALGPLLATGFGNYLNSELVLQTPMFQVVGGTENLAKAMAAKVKSLRLGARVTALAQPGQGVRVRYELDGTPHQLEADFAISTLPLPILNEIELEVPAAAKQAMGAVALASVGKIGLQFKRRFWEEDEGIYGGISRTSLDITQILYPSSGYLSKKGIVIGYYQNGEKAKAMGKLPHAARLASAVDQGSAIHPQYRAELESAFSVAWEHVPFNRGGWAQYTEAQRKSEYVALQQAHGALYLAGDSMSYLSGWMAGALGSARTVARRVHERASRQMSGSMSAAVALLLLAVLAAPARAQAPTPPAAPAAATPTAVPAPVARKAPPEAVTFYGSPSSPISGGVVIPAGAAFVWTSGTVPPVVNPDAPAGDRARFGDTKTQAAGILKAFETQLAAQGLTMADVVYLRAYLVADPAKGTIDTDGWNAAYARCSVPPPTRPSRRDRRSASPRSSTRSG
jgi:monoamine oxidase